MCVFFLNIYLFTSINFLVLHGICDEFYDFVEYFEHFQNFIIQVCGPYFCSPTM